MRGVQGASGWARSTRNSCEKSVPRSVTRYTALPSGENAAWRTEALPAVAASGSDAGALPGLEVHREEIRVVDGPVLLDQQPRAVQREPHRQPGPLLLGQPPRRARARDLGDVDVGVGAVATGAGVRQPPAVRREGERLVPALAVGEQLALAGLEVQPVQLEELGATGVLEEEDDSRIAGEPLRARPPAPCRTSAARASRAARSPGGSARRSRSGSGSGPTCRRPPGRRAPPSAIRCTTRARRRSRPAPAGLR